MRTYELQTTGPAPHAAEQPAHNPTKRQARLGRDLSVGWVLLFSFLSELAHCGLGVCRVFHAKRLKYAPFGKVLGTMPKSIIVFFWPAQQALWKSCQDTCTLCDKDLLLCAV